MVNSTAVIVTDDTTMTVTAPGGTVANTPTATFTGNVVVGSGATGSFSTPTGQVVTVRDGIVVNIT